MQIHSPLCITPRLLPGIQIGNSFISLDPATLEYHLDLQMENGKRIEHSANDFGPGAERDLGRMIGALLGFMSACAESFDYGIRTTGNPRDGENTDLFPLAIAAWCSQNSDELSILSCELEESENLITE